MKMKEILQAKNRSVKYEGKKWKQGQKDEEQDWFKTCYMKCAKEGNWPNQDDRMDMTKICEHVQKIYTDKH